MIRRTLLEWGRLAYGDCDNTIPEPAAARLAAVAQASTFAASGSGVLDHGRQYLRARGVVGVLAAPGCQLEILPKIEGLDETGVTDAPTLRHRLIHMLAVAQDIRVDVSELAHLGWQRDTVLEVLIRLFCRKLTDAIRQGMPRRYVADEEDRPSLRGRLNLTRQFSVLAAAPQKLACRFDTLSPDIALNQVMKAAVARLSRLAQAADNQRTLRELAFAYTDITEVTPAALPWDTIVLDRTNERWRELLALARLLLASRHQQTSGGAIDGHALLFEMNVLFEAYIARLLRRTLAGTDLSVTTQGGHRDCLYEGETGRFRTQPDIIVRSGNEMVLIIDTKWKRMTSRIDDPKQGVSQADVYQLMAYGQLYDCSRTMLLYPHHGELGAAAQLQNYAIAAKSSGRTLTIATMDVASGPMKVKEALGKLVATCLTPTA
ncbi:McrC family protein [Kaistia granuli]|uniref:McrC family protein n=1 Tax=Kaistia granuli TaxID=363259 RepID=UPI0003775ACE|nr:hypothetical protein [Kaistia granuli]